MAIFIAIVSGHSVSALVTPSLKTVAVPKPDNIEKFIKDKTAAIKLGKTLFWDMQLGSDGLQSCASCHFHAGADNRSKNQINPGLLRVNADGTSNADTNFDVGGAPNYQLQPADYPFHKLLDPDKRNPVLSDKNDVTSSQGVFNTQFINVIPGKAEDIVKQVPDPVFNVAKINVRRVEARNTPTVINAVFNFRNFWDGRAQNIFNGVNPFGLRDPDALIGRAEDPTKLALVNIAKDPNFRLNNSALASQAVGPPLSPFEMSADGRIFQNIGDKFSIANGKKLQRKLGKKLLPLRPLGKQIVHPQDSVLAAESRSPQPGLKTATYEKLIQDAFKPEWWNSSSMITIDANGNRSIVQRPNRSLTTDEYTLMEFNFSLFFGLAVQTYESTLVSDQTPYDNNALNTQQQQGKELFEGKAKCINCHGGAELTHASVSNVQNQRIERMIMGDDKQAVYDNGFYNIGVRPTLDDLGVGGKDPFGNPLSESRVAALGKFQPLLGAEPNITVGVGERIAADGAFKTPGLRNVELTAPYFHNGGQLTLRQVVEFYNRGGDFHEQNIDNLDPDIQNSGLKLTEDEKEALVSFLKALTDERVRLDKAPFDHPQLFVPNGHPGDTKSVTTNDKVQAKDQLLEIPAVGRDGGKGTPNFLSSTN